MQNQSQRFHIPSRGMLSSWADFTPCDCPAQAPPRAMPRPRGTHTRLDPPSHHVVHPSKYPRAQAHMHGLKAQHKRLPVPLSSSAAAAAAAAAAATATTAATPTLETRKKRRLWCQAAFLLQVGRQFKGRGCPGRGDPSEPSRRAHLRATIYRPRMPRPRRPFWAFSPGSPPGWRALTSARMILLRAACD
jgi:hypothetical protein